MIFILGNKSLSRILRLGSLNLLDEFKAVRNLSTMLNFTIECINFTVENIFKNRVVEDDWFLHDKRNGVSKVVEINFFNVDSIKKDLAVINVVESHEKVNESTLTTSTFSN